MNRWHCPPPQKAQRGFLQICVTRLIRFKKKLSQQTVSVSMCDVEEVASRVSTSSNHEATFTCSFSLSQRISSRRFIHRHLSEEPSGSRRRSDAFEGPIQFEGSVAPTGRLPSPDNAQPSVTSPDVLSCSSPIKRRVHVTARYQICSLSDCLALRP
jgi:hypothetical protein